MIRGKTLLLILVLSSPLFAENKSEENKVRFELPVDWVSSPQVNFEVVIPPGYTSLQSMEEWSSSPLIEFVPKGEDGENWSEIITINKFIGEKISASAFIAALSNRLAAKVQNAKWDYKTHTSDAVTKATLFISYDYNRIHEVMGALYYSGPYDCVGVQYTIRPSKNVSDEAAFAKIKQFFEESTRLSK